jgi:hypothetical protein
MFGIDEFTAIINPPDACILAVGGIAQVPVVKNGQVVPGNVMKVTLSCDHRAVDGATGAAFLQTLKSCWKTTFAFDYLDLWFVDSEPGRNRRTSVFAAKPTYSITPDSVTGNRKGWMQVNYAFTAKGDERFLMLGNFQHAELKKARKSSRKKWDVEYWIDDIELLPEDPSIPLCPQYEAIKDQLYRNNAKTPCKIYRKHPR